MDDKVMTMCLRYWYFSSERVVSICDFCNPSCQSLPLNFGSNFPIFDSVTYIVDNVNQFVPFMHQFLNVSQSFYLQNST